MPYHAKKNTAFDLTHTNHLLTYINTQAEKSFKSKQKNGEDCEVYCKQVSRIAFKNTEKYIYKYF